MSGNNEVIGGGGFHHVAIRVRDFEATMKFYTEALGFREKIAWGEGDKRAVMLDSGDGNYLEVFAGGTAGEKPEGTILHFAIRTDDCDAALERSRAAATGRLSSSFRTRLPDLEGRSLTSVRHSICR